MGGKFRFVALYCAMVFAGFAHAEIDGERVRKFDLALKTLGIPAEKTPDFSDFPVAGSVSTTDLLSIAKFIDPEGGLRRYLSITPSRLDFYPEFFRAAGPNDAPDYALATGSPTNRDSPELLARLARVSMNVRSGTRYPFAGLRVLIDPGHMGSLFWDDKDGKFVTIAGKTVSEGKLTLWTARLLAAELEKLGATVYLTRSDLVPVTPYTWDNFNPAGRLAAYYYKSYDDWMPKYLALSDAELVRRLPTAPEVQKMKTFSGKVYLYLQEDMEARAQILDVLKPDLFIDLHYDSQEIDRLQSSRDDVSVYVPGAVQKTETGARSERTDALKHLLEVRRWKQSARMATTLVTSVAKNLGLPLLKDAGEDPPTVKFADGVFARNIFETRRATSSLCAFFESFHYDYVREFPRLTTLDKTATFRGTTYRYPSRLEGVSNGIRDGLVTYFHDFQE